MIQCSLYSIKTITKKMSILFLFFLGLFYVSCSEESNKEPLGTYDDNYGLYVIDDGQGSYEMDDVYSAFNDTEEKIGKALNDYAVKMLIDYGSNIENTLLSPISASVLYSMMANLTGENVNNSIQKEMGIANYSVGDINSYCCKLINKENSSGDNLAIQNDVWINNQSSVYNSFLSLAKIYKAKVKGIEFGSTAGNTAMNNSIGNKMKNTDVGKMSSWDGVNMAVTSSMYLKKKWKDKMTLSSEQFVFSNADGSICESRMLISSRYAKYASYKNFDILEIPYEGDDYSLYIVYPHESNLLEQSLNELGEVGFAKCIGSMESELVSIRFPRFKCETLINLNQSRDSRQAESSIMFKTKLPKISPSNFALSDMYQACSIELNQEGMSVSVESTGIEVGWTGSTPGGKQQVVKCIDFHIEHPFAIFIRDSQLGVITYASCIKMISAL